MSEAVVNADAWSGLIDDFRIWNSPLSSHEVANLMSNPENVKRDSLVAEYKFDSIYENIVLTAVAMKITATW